MILRQLGYTAAYRTLDDQNFRLASLIQHVQLVASSTKTNGYKHKKGGIVVPQWIPAKGFCEYKNPVFSFVHSGTQFLENCDIQKAVEKENRQHRLKSQQENK